MTTSPPPQAPPVLRVEALVKHFGRVAAVSGVTFEVRPGELVGFIGPNGAGKSTTYRCIVGLHQPDAGRVQVAGMDVQSQRIHALRQLGYVGQDLDIYQYLTGEELLRLVADLHELPPDLAEQRSAELVELMGLNDAMRRLVHQYSGGMARKLAIAAALLPHPPLVLLDESFAGLDPESTAAIQQYLDARRAEGTAVLLSSHVLEMLERWVTRVVMLLGGKVVEDLPRAALDAVLGDLGSLTALYLDRVSAASRRQAEGASSEA